MKTVKIAWLFPDTLYLHGERGNLLALQRFISLAGLEPEVVRVEFDGGKSPVGDAAKGSTKVSSLSVSEFDPEDFDIIYCPPGEISSADEVISALKPNLDQLNEFIEAGKVLLVTGTSVAFFTKQIKRVDGHAIDGLSILNVMTCEREEVYGDDNYFACDYNGKHMEIIGNQIQMVNFENCGENAFGRLEYGFGNNGNDREEGFIRMNSIFTNTLAPILVANPTLTKEIVCVACGEMEGFDAAGMDIDLDIEEKSFATKKEFIETKVTRLTNCK